jgi:hypothetical protein
VLTITSWLTEFFDEREARVRHRELLTLGAGALSGLTVKMGVILREAFPQ